MDLNQMLAFSLVAFLLVITPGPNIILIAKTVPTSGKAAGFANIAGFFAAMQVHGALSILGISLILLKSSQAFFVLKIIGAAYLCWIGVKALISAAKPLTQSAEVKPARNKRTFIRAFCEGFVSNLFNPKTSMFYLAAFPQFVSIGEGAVASAFLLVFIHAMINVFWFGAIVILFTKLVGAADNLHFQRWIKMITGVIFIGFGAKMATIKI